MSCDHADHGGSYVLGALSPAERVAFEQHLPGCAGCARSVRELAGLPGLLARVDPSVLDEAPGDEPVPETLLPSLLRAVRRTRRRRTLMTAGAAAAALAAAVALPLTLGADRDRAPVAAPQPTSTAPATGVRHVMAPVGEAPVRATVVLARVAWGTRLDLTCTYGGGPERYHLPRTATYGLFVRTRDGRTEQVGTWRSLEGRTMRVTAATAAPRQDIASVEVRTANGQPVLELTT
jgi:hypothetical protein